MLMIQEIRMEKSILLMFSYLRTFFLIFDGKIDWNVHA